ncbi:Chromosomal replication initiator protein DnaA, partial [Clarias magur]
MAGGWVWIQACVGWEDKNSIASLAEHLRAGQEIGKSPTQHKSSHDLYVEQAKEQPGILASSIPVKSSWERITSTARGQIFQHWSARSRQTFPLPPR